MPGFRAFLFIVTLSITIVTTQVAEPDVRIKRSDDVPALTSVVEGLSQRVNQLEAHVTSLENKLNKAQTHVAFHAYHSTDPFDVVSKGTIIFDSSTINVGNAYDKQTGIFTAPVSGTYIFFTNCMAKEPNAEETYIMVNGAPVASCYSHSTHEDPHEQGAALTIVHLTLGQKVWVQLYQNAELVRGYRWNTFAGFLDRADF